MLAACRNKICKYRGIIHDTQIDLIQDLIEIIGVIPEQKPFTSCISLLCPEEALFLFKQRMHLKYHQQMLFLTYLYDTVNIRNCLGEQLTIRIIPIRWCICNNLSILRKPLLSDQIMIICFNLLIIRLIQASWISGSYDLLLR